MISKLFVLFLLLTSYFLLLPPYAAAQHFESDSFIIDWGNFNITSGTKASTNYRLSDTVGQNAPGQYDSQNYTLKAGAQYAYDTTYPFSFSISSLQINFGSLEVGIASTATNIIEVSSPSGRGYQVTASENHPLTATTLGTTIPDTTCDSGCSESVSGLWTSSTAYGFGFNASGAGSTGYFSSSNHFRQFADTSLGESPQIIMSETIRQQNRQSVITYKTLISGLQPADTYQNSLTFTATPIY